MAKKNADQNTDQNLENGNSVDNLLDGGADTRPTEQIDDEIKAMQEKIKALRAEKKGQKEKKVRENKGVMCTFQNKAGETITGLGVTYYVVRQGGKLHYKEASKVHLMTEEEVTAYNAEQAAKA